MRQDISLAQQKIRSAFTLIELIYAIVIMGITFVTLPIIMLTNNTSLEQNLEQEAIFVTATKIGQILTFAWDDQSRLPGAILASAEVLDVATGDLDFNRTNPNSDFRRGHFQEALHRRMTPHATPRVVTANGALGSEGGAPNDIDDFDGTTDNTSIAAGSQLGYKSGYNLNTCVDYVDDGIDSGINYRTNTTIVFTFRTSTKCFNGSDAPTNKATNLKMVQVSVDKVTAAGGAYDENNIIVLRSYAANIGETDFYKRTYQ